MNTFLARLFASAVVLATAAFAPTHAQRPAWGKMSSFVRELCQQETNTQHPTPNIHHPSPTPHHPTLCAFVRIEGDGEAVLQAHGGRSLARFGDIYIADIPLASLARLSLQPAVRRIEAHRSHSVANDSCAVHLGLLPAYAGTGLPQPYTGQGVVVGIMDIGFDLTHPTFYNADLSAYRIRRFWDQLSPDTLSSTLYVGRDYTSENDILGIAHSFDGLHSTHGTHTLGTAAGSGYGSPYRGMAWEADLCVVSNAVSNNAYLIDSTQLYKYTYATDALGFKYIFDYAASIGQPCVISFSEGSAQDFHGDDQLYYEVLDSLTGPGRILVAAAGNDAQLPTYIHKPVGQASAGNFLFSTGKTVMVTAKSRTAFTLRTTIYVPDGSGDRPQYAYQVDTRRVLAAPDSMLTDTLTTGSRQHIITVTAYPSCYNAAETCYDLTVVCDQDGVGMHQPVSVELLGKNADVELFRAGGYICPNALNPDLNDGEAAYCVNSPSSAPCAISVGATAYRKGAYNYKGEWRETDLGSGGVRSSYSSVGPTFDGRMKPEVMAPGSNVISAYSSYYLETHPDARDIDEDVAHFTAPNGRTYAWNCNSGTSMAAPAAAGVVALWLQAKPDLTPDEIRTVISRTSTHTDSTLTYPNQFYGYGQINAYHGLLHILGYTDIRGISTRPTTAHIGINAARQAVITFPRPTTAPCTAHLYAPGGQLLRTVRIPTGVERYTIDMQTLPEGIYALQINSPESYHGSALLKR